MDILVYTSEPLKGDGMIRLMPFLLACCIAAVLLAQQTPQSGETVFFGKAGCAS